MNKPDIWLPFHRTPVAGDALSRVEQAVNGGHSLGGGGHWSRVCESALERATGSPMALLTTSCSQALQMAAQLLDLRPGDKVILPSWTFASAASAFVMCGATPVFVDIDDQTLNIDPDQVRKAVSPAVKAICVTHYGGLAADMDALMAIAEEHGLWLVEDAAQGYLARHGDRHLGTIGHLGTLSFHHTKSVGAGEAGALLVNDPAFTARAEMLREKGTNRRAFERGEVSSYDWQLPGTGGAPSELVAAYLSAQLDSAQDWLDARKACESRYLSRLPLLAPGLRLTGRPGYVTSNAYSMAVRVPANDRASIRQALAASGIETMLHYQPLHTSAQALRITGQAPSLPVTERTAREVLRLPLHPYMSCEDTIRVCDHIQRILG